MNIKHLLSICVVALSGCVSSGIPSINTTEVDQKVIDNTEKTFIGIPVFLSYEGSTARLNDEWLITAAHNAKIISVVYDEVHYHPTCDVALVKDHGTNTVDVGVLYHGQDVRIAGYPVYMPMSISTGKYYADVSVPMWEYPDCIYSITDAAMASGMSGGGVYNMDNELVGITSFVITDATFEDDVFDDVEGKTVTAFLPLFYVREWLSDITGEEFY